MASEAERPKSLKEAWELNERLLAEDCIRRGRPAEKAPWISQMAWSLGARALLEVLKQTEPEKLLAAIWRAERDLDDLGKAAAGSMVDDLGIKGAIELLLGRPRPGDGDSLDVRPPRRDAR